MRSIYRLTRSRFPKASDGLPAFYFAPQSNVLRSAPDIVQRVGPDFSVFATIHPISSSGFLFAVVDPSNTYVQFGLRLSSPEPDYRQGRPHVSRKRSHQPSKYHRDLALLRRHISRRWRQTSAVTSAHSWANFCCRHVGGRLSCRPVVVAGRADSRTRRDAFHRLRSSFTGRHRRSAAAGTHAFEPAAMLYVAQGGPRFVNKFEVSVLNRATFDKPL
jgi:hypothetical protein